MAQTRLDGAIPEDPYAYDAYISQMRVEEFPMLRDSLYLDHAGTTLCSKSTMERFHSDMMAKLYGNPHSAAPSSRRSMEMIDCVRSRILDFFKANPADFDFVFTANATAAIKLVAEGWREMGEAGDFAYHADSHTSVVGMREALGGGVCLASDEDVEAWMSSGDGNEEGCQLLAFPAQSNMNGRRLPLEWCRKAREAGRSKQTYTLLDAAAFLSTSPLDFSNVDSAPDFTALSFYKIFGFPDLGALLVKKSSAHILDRRKYFGGGTVDTVVCVGEQWHARKAGPLHERLEDGTLPIHSILALQSALNTHEELFQSLERVSQHTAILANDLYDGLLSLRHGNGMPVCNIYKGKASAYGDSQTQGPVIAFNLRDINGEWMSNTEVEKLASIKDIHLRTGGVCNPGGIATALDLAPWEMRENFSAGHRCGSENDIMNGKPTGVIRMSLGAMSTSSDVERAVAFIDEFFVCRELPRSQASSPVVECRQTKFYVESLNVYPIKSCGGWQVPTNQAWDIRSEGLAWDREWCVVHSGNGKALSQKQYPRMALIRPSFDFKAGVLYVRILGLQRTIRVPLSRNPAAYMTPLRSFDASICGDAVETLTYADPAIADFFTAAIGIPCTLARFNAASAVGRHSKPHLALSRPRVQNELPRPITFTNESPILTITRSSLNRLNEQIKLSGGKAARPSVFRANIVLAENPLLSPGNEQPWAEDAWSGMRVGGADGPVLEFLGGCRRCQMVCVDQETGEREKEGQPFVTLAKTRRFGGRVLFGVHSSLVGKSARVMVGEEVDVWKREEGG